MGAYSIDHPWTTTARASAPSTTRSDGVRLLQAFALAVMVIPSTTVLGGLGAPGSPASLVGLCAFGAYGVAVLLGIHSPTRQRHPIQGVLGVLWVSALASYLLMDRATLSAVQLRGADRFLLQLAVISGIALVAAEWLRTLEGVRRVIRVLCWGGAFCGVVAILQYGLNFDLAQYVRELPGLTQNHDNPATLARGSLRRATGTAITPIELGVVSGMLLPLAVYLGMYDTDRDLAKRWAPTVLLTMGIGTSVSRSAVIAIIVALGLLLVLLPPVRRLAALLALPFALVAVFVSAHGLIGTLANFFSIGSSDASIQYRLNDYALVERLWGQAPWFGHGGWTYMPDPVLNQLDFFDNQYLGALVDLGVVGFVALLVFLLVPASSALVARSRSRDPELRVLCAALAGSGFAAAACSVTFDSLGFPMFAGVYALVVGLTGACWRLAARERTRTAGSARPSTWTPLRAGAPNPVGEGL